MLHPKCRKFICPCIRHKHDTSMARLDVCNRWILTFHQVSKAFSAAEKSIEKNGAHKTETHTVKLRTGYCIWINVTVQREYKFLNKHKKKQMHCIQERVTATTITMFDFSIVCPTMQLIFPICLRWTHNHSIRFLSSHMPCIRIVEETREVMRVQSMAFYLIRCGRFSLLVN